MACPDATGLCTKEADGACSKPTQLDESIAVPTVYSVEGGASSFRVLWLPPIIGNNEITVEIIANLQGTSTFYKRTVVLQVDGYADYDDQGSGLPTSQSYKWWLRMVDEGFHGPWVTGLAITDPGWNSGSNTITFHGEAVLHNGEAVIE